MSASALDECRPPVLADVSSALSRGGGADRRAVHFRQKLSGARTAPISYNGRQAHGFRRRGTSGISVGGRVASSSGLLGFFSHSGWGRQSPREETEPRQTDGQRKGR